MANYPNFSTFSFAQTIKELESRIVSWGNELTRELDFRDTTEENAPATRILTVVSTGTISNPQNGDIAFSLSASKFRGFVSGTGFVDFH